VSSLGPRVADDEAGEGGYCRGREEEESSSSSPSGQVSAVEEDSQVGQLVLVGAPHPPPLSRRMAQALATTNR
jgi:hypothetical protein